MDESALGCSASRESLAWSKLADGDLAQARRLFLECLASEREPPTRLGDVCIGIGQCFVEEGQTSEAIKYFWMALANGPSAHLRSIAEKFLLTELEQSLTAGDIPAKLAA